MLDLSGHDGAGDAFFVEGFDEPGKLAEGEPVDGGRSVAFYLRVGFFLNGGDDDLVALGSGGVKDEEGEAAIAGDQAQAFRQWRH